jgi:hypothetical protein
LLFEIHFVHFFYYTVPLYFLPIANIQVGIAACKYVDKELLLLAR